MFVTRPFGPSIALVCYEPGGSEQDHEHRLRHPHASFDLDQQHNFTHNTHTRSEALLVQVIRTRPSVDGPVQRHGGTGVAAVHALCGLHTGDNSTARTTGEVPICASDSRGSEQMQSFTKHVSFLNEPSQHSTWIDRIDTFFPSPTPSLL